MLWFGIYPLKNLYAKTFIISVMALDMGNWEMPGCIWGPEDGVFGRFSPVGRDSGRLASCLIVCRVNVGKKAALCKSKQSFPRSLTVVGIWAESSPEPDRCWYPDAGFLTSSTVRKFLLCETLFCATVVAKQTNMVRGKKIRIRCRQRAYANKTFLVPMERKC